MPGSTSRPPAVLVTSVAGLALVVRLLASALARPPVICCCSCCLGVSLTGYVGWWQAALAVVTVVHPFSNEVSSQRPQQRVLLGGPSCLHSPGPGRVIAQAHLSESAQAGACMLHEVTVRHCRDRGGVPMAWWDFCSEDRRMSCACVRSAPHQQMPGL